jgi:hypothetical protein
MLLGQPGFGTLYGGVFQFGKILNEKRQYAQLKFSIISEKLPSRPLTPSQLCCGFRPALDCIFLNLLTLESISF